MQFFLKDVRAKIFLSIDLLIVCCSMMYLCQECKKQLTAADLVSEKKRVENYPDCGILAHVIWHDLQRFIVKNIEIDSTEAKDLSHILYNILTKFNSSRSI